MGNKVEFVYQPVEDNSFTKEGEGYWICCGALNSYNKINEWYAFDERIKELFLTKKGRFGSLLLDGLLGGEAEHPVLPSSMTEYEKDSRYLTVEPSRRSHNITGIRFEETSSFSTDSGGKPGPNKMVKIYCLIVPLNNELGKTLRSMIESKGNVAFSIRTFSRDAVDPSTGRLHVHLTNPITFDWVTRGGIGAATKNKTDREFRNESDLVPPSQLGLNGCFRDMKKAVSNVSLPDDPDKRTESHNEIERMMQLNDEFDHQVQANRTAMNFLKKF